MNKSKVIEHLAERTGHPSQVAELAVKTFFGNIKLALSTGGKVEIRGFGSFFVKNYKGYIGRNPRTGKKVNVPPKKLAIFRTGKDLRERIKNSENPIKNKKELAT